MATYNYTVTARSDNTAYLWTGHGLSNEPDPTITIRAGDTLRVTNNTGGHVIRLYNDPSVSSGSQVAAQSGTLLTYTPTSTGVFYYKCSSHAAMAGSVIVSPATDDGSPESNGDVGPLNYTTSPVTINQMRDKINEIIMKGVGGGGVEISETPPAGAKEGDLWYDPVNLSLYVWVAGSLNAWVDVGDGGGQSGGGASVTVSSTAPSGASEGDLWFDDVEGTLYVWIAGSLNAWISTSGGSSGGASVTASATAPTAPGDGDLWFDTSVMELYVYVEAESSWIQTNGGGGSGSGTGSGGDWALILGGSIMCPPVVVDDRVFYTTYGGGTAGYALIESTTGGEWVANHQPYAQGTWDFDGRATSWASNYPSGWVDGAASTSTNAVIYWSHAGGWLLRQDFNRTNKTSTFTHWLNGIGGSALASNSGWEIQAMYDNTILSTMSYPAADSAVHAAAIYDNQRNPTTLAHTQTKGYFPSFKGSNFGGAFPNGFMPWDATVTSTYMSCMGVNHETGRIYFSYSGWNEQIVVGQITTAVGSTADRWYRALGQVRRTANDASNTGTYHVDFVKAFNNPFLAPHTAGVNYKKRVIFDVDTGEPLYMTKGHHNGAWQQGGAEIINWNSSWT